MEKKEQLFQLIHNDTSEKIKKNNLKEIGLDALEVSLNLKMDRANVSRILNQLYNDGRVIKTSTRPVLYIDRLAIDINFPNTHIPSIIPKNKNFVDYVNTFQEKLNEEIVNSFDMYITNPRHSKMYEPIRKAKSAILYPNGLNTLIFGQRGTGRFQFAKALTQYAKEVNIIDKKVNPIYVECLNYNVSNEQSLLRLLFGEYILQTDSLKKGIFQNANNSIIIINNIDHIPTQTSSAIYNSILNKTFSPINSNKTYTLNSLIIATATKQSILSNTDIRRCFPMIIDVPNLHDRSIVEKLVIILQYLQEESNSINKTIRISKDALSCFVMSEYEGNLAHLRAEIRQACAMGYENYYREQSFFITIGFNEISTPVLNNIFNINDRLNELYGTLDLFTNDYLFFSANQKNKELELLYKLNTENDVEDIIHIHKINEEIINQCISDIDNASTIQLNSIRSILLQKIYDIVYPIIKNHKIHKNENLLYGLLLHISDEINSITSGRNLNTDKQLSTKIARNNDYEYAKHIITSVANSYGIVFPPYEEDYIATYLYLSSQWIDKKYIQILLASSNKELIKNYAEYINSQFSKTHTSYISLPVKQTNLNSTALEIVKKFKEIDRGKGVILITDFENIDDLNKSLHQFYKEEFVIYSDLSVQKLVSIAEKVESLGVTIQSIDAFDQIKSPNESKSNLVETHAQDLLSNIQNKLLYESLVFLNPEKACQSLFNVFQNILKDLNLHYSDDLLIKFLFHTVFTLERCIKKEPYAYPKAKTIINENEFLFSTLDKNFKIINEIFAIQIPISEMAYIMEIFLSYLF